MTIQAASSCGKLRQAAGWLDKKSSPTPETQGDFDGPAYFQAGFQGAVEGFALRGAAGCVSSAGAALAGVFVEDKTRSNVLAVITGTTIGAVLSFATTSTPTVALKIASITTGALLGAFQTYRGNQKSRVRDSGGNAAMLAGPFLHGPSKVAAGIASAVAEKFGPADSPAVKAAIGGAVGAGLGVGLSLIHFAPLGPVAAGLVCGGAGALGPFFGPRFSQFFRNFSKDAGQGIETGLLKTGVIDHPLNPRTRNCIGAIPSSFIKEGTRDLIYADGSIVGLLLGGVCESIQQADIFLHSGKVDGPAPSPLGSQNPVPEQPHATRALRRAAA